MTRQFPGDVSRTSSGIVLVDVQKAFASSDGSIAESGTDVSPATETLPAVRELIDVARDVGIPLFFTRSVRRADERDAPHRIYDVVPDVYRGEQATCREGTTDVEYADRIDPRPEDYEVTKTRYNGFHDTPLELYLRNEGVETVLLAGVTSNVCVESTARGAHERGFNVVMVEDCCAAYSVDEHRSAAHTVESYLGAVTTLRRVKEWLEA